MSCSSDRRYVSRATHRAFSLIEVMVVVVIIGVLAGAVVVKVGDYVDRAKINRARSDVATIMTAVEAFYASESRYPSNEEGLGVLPLQSQTDPWKRVYQYNMPGREAAYEIVSYGADGRPGGDGINADILSSELEENG